MIGTTIALIMAASAAATAGGQVAAAKMGSNAAKRAGDQQAKAAADAEAFARDQDAKDRQQYQTEYDRRTQIEDADRARRQALMDEMGAARDAFTGQTGGRTLAQLSPTALPAGPATMPTGWKPGDPLATAAAPTPSAAPSTPPPIPASLAALSPAQTSRAPMPAPQMVPPPTMPPPMPPGAAPYVPVIPRRTAPTLAALRY